MQEWYAGTVTSTRRDTIRGRSRPASRVLYDAVGPWPALAYWHCQTRQDTSAGRADKGETERRAKREAAQACMQRAASAKGPHRRRNTRGHEYASDSRSQKTLEPWQTREGRSRPFSLVRSKQVLTGSAGLLSAAIHPGLLGNRVLQHTLAQAEAHQPSPAPPKRVHNQGARRAPRNMCSRTATHR